MIFNIPVPDILLTERCNMNCKYCFEHKKNGLDIDQKELKDYINKNTNMSFFLFGGEPLLAIDLITEIIDIINNSNLRNERKEEMLKSCKMVITNGTLIKSNLKKIKEYGLEMQISLDGSKETHDLNRVFKDGSPTFDIVYDSIELCQKNNIKWSIHGVVNKQTLPFLADTTMFIIDLYNKFKGTRETINRMSQNLYQIIFEQEYDDNDVDILLEQFQEVCERIDKSPQFNREQKKQLIKAFLNRSGGVCSVGTTLLAIDVNFNIYPCHRLVAFEEERKKYCLGNVYEPDKFSKFELFNSYFHQRFINKVVYSSGVNFRDGKDENTKWINWCPSTNLETSGSIYFQNPKYNIMHVELNRLIIFLEKKYNI